MTNAFFTPFFFVLKRHFSTDGITRDILTITVNCTGKPWQYGIEEKVKSCSFAVVLQVFGKPYFFSSFLM
jgi:hypothetical protein